MPLHTTIPDMRFNRIIQPETKYLQLFVNHPYLHWQWLTKKEIKKEIQKAEGQTYIMKIFKLKDANIVFDLEVESEGFFNRSIKNTAKLKIKPLS